MREEGDHDGTGEDPAVSRDGHVAGEARIVIFNLGRPYQDTEDPREPVQVPPKRQENSPYSRFYLNFTNFPTALQSSLPILFNYFTTALRLHSPKVQTLTRCLLGRRGRMACKVERIVERGHLALFHISGYLQEMHVHLIEEMMAKETDPIAFDLAEVTLVGSEAVKFLAACDAKGIEIRNCPAFIREWMSKA